MIRLPVDALEVLESLSDAEGEFLSLFKALSIAGSGTLVLPQSRKMEVYGALLLHVIANLVEAQTEIEQLKGQLAILKVDKEDASDADGTNAEDD